MILGTYEHLRSSGFLHLPHKSTLQQYSNFTESTTGFNPDVIKFFFDEIKIDKLTENEKNIALLFDEMHIKSGLVFSRSSGKLVGFTDMGDINNELDEFNRNIDGCREPELATHILTFMARGLHKRFNFPIGYFSSKGFDSDQLFPVVWQAVEVMEMNGMKVRAFVCDGASPNRRFYRLHKLPDDLNVAVDGVVYWAWNLYAADDRKIYFICDVPHLIKTVRNNFENSHGNLNTRHLLVSFTFYISPENIF